MKIETIDGKKAGKEKWLLTDRKQYYCPECGEYWGYFDKTKKDQPKGNHRICPECDPLGKGYGVIQKEYNQFFRKDKDFWKKSFEEQWQINNEIQDENNFLKAEIGQLKTQIDDFFRILEEDFKISKQEHAEKQREEEVIEQVYPDYVIENNKKCEDSPTGMVCAICGKIIHDPFTVEYVGKYPLYYCSAICGKKAGFDQREG